MEGCGKGKLCHINGNILCKDEVKVGSERTMKAEVKFINAFFLGLDVNWC